MRVAIIGLGLIGGSLGLCLREKKIATYISGVDNDESHTREALRLNLVDEILPMTDAVEHADMIFLAMPVNAIAAILPQLLDEITPGQIVLDVGSTKSEIALAVNDHANRFRFVATHPMWGTEYSGPTAAVSNAFLDKAVVICDAERSDPEAVATTEKVYQQLGMHIVHMSSREHDLHVAYISHISHITSFALANTVLEKEKEDDKIFELASGGFESTVRLAKSNPVTWASIFMQNRENVLDVLNEHISQLRKFKSCLEKENVDYLLLLMDNANKIKHILK